MHPPCAPTQPHFLQGWGIPAPVAGATMTRTQASCQAIDNCCQLLLKCSDEQVLSIALPRVEALVLICHEVDYPMADQKRDLRRETEEEF